MYLNHIAKTIFRFLFVVVVVGLFEITEIEAAGNQKTSSGETKQAIESYDYSDEVEVANGEVSDPKSTIKPYFETKTNTVYATKEIENITLECLPTNFNDSKHQILWYNDEHPITNGNTSLSVDKYTVDDKYRLTIFNYNKNVGGNFSCVVLPTDIRQYVIIEFGAPPENMTNQKDGSNKIFIGFGLTLTTAITIVLSNYWVKF